MTPVPLPGFHFTRIPVTDFTLYSSSTDCGSTLFFLHILPLSFSKTGILPFLVSPPQGLTLSRSPILGPGAPLRAAWSTDGYWLPDSFSSPSSGGTQTDDLLSKVSDDDHLAELPCYCLNKNSPLQPVSTVRWKCPQNPHLHKPCLAH